MPSPPSVPDSQPSQAPHWRIRTRAIPLTRPVIVGILNVTPDSFSDGGLYLSRDDAARRADQIAAEGADVIDIGGESTRPGAQRIHTEEELARVLPVLQAVRKRHADCAISVDTTRSEVARAVLGEGADAINDVSGLRLDPRLAVETAAVGAGLILMHSRGDADEMASYRFAEYGDDVVADVMSELRESLQRAREAGVEEPCIVLDPGIGFSKRAEHSIAVLRGINRLIALGCPLMIGASRKRVIGELTGTTAPLERRDGTIGAHVAALAKGARLFRVHDVLAHRHALDAAWRILA